MPFSWFVRFCKRFRRRRNPLVPLWHEINTNLERFFVIDQRGFISGPFELDVWREARMRLGKHDEDIFFRYIAGIEWFNKAFADCRAFEGICTAEPGTMTREQAELLHEKKLALEGLFKEMEPLILEARARLREILEREA